MRGTKIVNWRQLMQEDGWKLVIVKRGQRAFKITGLTWIVERSFAWIGRNRRMSKDYEYSVQTSESIDRARHSPPHAQSPPAHIILFKHPLSGKRVISAWCGKLKLP
jgi:transposase